jgi:hypothetical protein
MSSGQDDHAPLVEAWLDEPVWLPPSDTDRIARLVEQTPQQRGWRPFGSGPADLVFRAVRLVVAASVVAGVGAFLIASGALTPQPDAVRPGSITSPDATATARPTVDSGGLVTQEIEPGVVRIIRDDAGHDLDEKHPTHRYDMDGIAIAPDHSVWLVTSYSRSDNEANPPGMHLWALGRPGTVTIPDWVSASNPLAMAGGRVLFIGDRIVRFEDGRFVRDDGPLSRPSGASQLWIVQPDELLALVPDGERAAPPGRPLVALWDGSEWTTPDLAGQRVRSAGATCSTGGIGVTCHRFGDPRTFLAGTPINQLAAAPDGTVWAVGGHAGDNGGLYRITLE